MYSGGLSMNLSLKSLLLVILAIFSLSPAIIAAEKSPFTNIGFGWFPGRGDFIKVENYEYMTEDKTHFLIQVEGMDYKEIIKKTKAMYGKKYKCRLAEHFVATMAELGIQIGDTVNLQVYLFNGGHQTLDLKDVPVTEENLLDIQFETNFCK
jgi:hypothetical protein